MSTCPKSWREANDSFHGRALQTRRPEERNQSQLVPMGPSDHGGSGGRSPIFVKQGRTSLRPTLTRKNFIVHKTCVAHSDVWARPRKQVQNFREPCLKRQFLVSQPSTVSVLQRSNDSPKMMLTSGIPTANETSVVDLKRCRRRCRKDVRLCRPRC